MNCPVSKTCELARRAATLTAGLTLAATVSAAPRPCVTQAAQRFDVPAAVLAAIVQQESAGRCPSRHPGNPNGSYDIGCAGINSTWLPLLQQRFSLSEQDLHDPCTNVHVGAWLLARNFAQYGDHWRAVGAYNARSEILRMEYVWHIVHQLRHSSSR